MGRSIYCSTCKKEKEPGRDNESRCKLCKSEANKLKRLKKRQEAGLEPYGSGRSPYCCDCKGLKERKFKLGKRTIAAVRNEFGGHAVEKR